MMKEPLKDGNNPNPNLTLTLDSTRRNKHKYELQSQRNNTTHRKQKNEPKIGTKTQEITQRQTKTMTGKKKV